MTSVKKTLDVHEFCKRHLLTKTFKCDEQEPKCKKSEILELIDLVIELFKKESTLSTISPPVTIVGDIHGQFVDLLRLLNARNVKNGGKKSYGMTSRRWVFLGDYVDRGPHSLQCICTVFSLKVLFPKQYLLLRGNHETRAINCTYGFKEELDKKFEAKDADHLWSRFNDAFAWMPLAALVGEKVLCMHGGISPELKSLDDIRNIQRPIVDIHTHPLALDLLWSDPEPNDMKEVSFTKNANRGLSVCFNEAAVYEIVAKFNLLMIVRGHQLVPGGFQFFANHKLCTVFSAPNYMNRTTNKGAALMLSQDGVCSIMTMKNINPPKENDSKCQEVTVAPDRSASLPVVEPTKKEDSKKDAPKDAPKI